jgi:hypothetical protein
MRWVAVAVFVVGLVLLIVALFADQLGFGASGSGFGWKQLIGTIVGAGLCIGGALGWWRITRAGSGEEA